MSVKTYSSSGSFVHSCPTASGIFGTTLDNSTWTINFANRYLTGSSSYTGFISYVDSLENAKLQAIENAILQRTGANECQYVVRVIFTGYCDELANIPTIPSAPPPPPPPPPPPTVYATGLAPWTGIYRGFADLTSDYNFGGPDGILDHYMSFLWRNFPYTARIQSAELYPLSSLLPQLPTLHSTYKNGTHPSNIYYLGMVLSTGNNIYAPGLFRATAKNQFATGDWFYDFSGNLSGSLFLSFHANRKDTVNIVTGFYLRINYNNNTGWSGVINTTVDRTYFTSLT